jgi:CHAT domain-containing protein
LNHGRSRHIALFKLLLPLTFFVIGSISLFGQSDAASARTLQEQADAAMEAGDLEEAATLFARSRDHYYSGELPDAAVEVSTGLAITHLYLGDIPTALDILDAARDSCLRLLPGNDSLLADVLALLGTLSNYAGDNERALQVTQEAVEANLRLREYRLEELADCYHNLGAIYFARSDYVNASEYEIAARKAYFELGAVQAYAATGINLGLTLLRLGEVERALEILRESERLAEPEALDRNQRSAIYVNMGLALLEMKQWEAAREALGKVLQQDDPPRTYLAYAEGNIGLAYLQEGNPGPAIDHLEQAVARMEARNRPTSDELAKLRLHLAQALRIRDQDQAAMQTLENGIRGQLALAENVRIDTLEIFNRPCNFRTLMRLLAERADLLDHLGQGDKALRAYNQAFAVIDRLRRSYQADGSKQFFSGYVMPIYEKSMDLAWRMYQREGNTAYLESALAISERNKVILLVESMLEARIRREGHLSDSLLEAERSLQIAIDYYEREVYKAEEKGDSARISMYADYLMEKRAAYDQLQTQLEQEFRYTSSLSADLKLRSDYLVTASDLDGYARGNSTTILEYFLGESAIYAFVISRDRQEMVRLNRPADLNSAIAAYRKVLSDWEFIFEQPEKTWQGIVTGGRRFYQEWLASIFPDSLPARLIVIPDGPMSFIPFEALLSDHSGDAGNYLSLPFLVRQSEISYHYSGTLLLKESDFDASRESVANCGVGMAFAPVYGDSAPLSVPQMSLRSGEAALPGAQAEVQALKNHFGVKLFTGDEASEVAFKENIGRYSIVHLAMHGILDDERADFSYLAFSKVDSNEDGRLHAYELERLRLPAQLVVLSACETGTGQLVKGEGVLSLAREFIYAGAESVLMSLWKLEDRATGQLSETLYARLAEGKPRSTALREAKLEYLDNADDFSAHPGFWAGMVLVGERDELELAAGFPWMWVGLGMGGLLVLLLLGRRVLR